ncbi:MAG TPA: ABC transporter substrate-binding protein, partial [Alphaproteobacteria bacterium]|nr:ABC transporter substrate-binding protein [Alphaproteobacteria bacterium]
MRPLIRWVHALVAALVLGLLATMTAGAGTPRNALIMALQIDDIISLDPAEVFEFSGAEYIANVYDRLIAYEPPDFTTLAGGLAERWEIAEDGRSYTFDIRPGLAFHSGNPVTAFDAAYSLVRVVKLNKSPAFILTQFGFTPENVEERIRALDERRLLFVTDKAYAPSLVLNCLTAGIGSIVDSALLKEHEADGDMGHGWLRTHSAGSGPFRLKEWRPNELLVLEGFEGHWRGAPAMRRVLIRHIA